MRAATMRIVPVVATVICQPVDTGTPPEKGLDHQVLKEADPGMSIADARRQLGSQSRATSAGRRRTATRPFQVRGLERLREERILRRLFGTRA